MNDFVDPLWLGAVAGVLASAPPGPVGAICAQRSVRDGARAGIACGLAIALGQAVHATIAACAPLDLGTQSGTLRRAAALAAAVVLFWLGWRELRRRRAGPAHASPRAPRSATILLLSLATPGTLPAFLLLFSTFGIQGSPQAAVGAVLGSLAWWTLLACGLAALRGRAASLLPRVERACGWLLCLGACWAARIALF